ncbi:helix-turn-helix domain-containing protein [Micromonosporaceae bacterium Da 78-11]
MVVAAMDLFGRQGYHATTIAQIEAAAGLSAGAGGLYRHFRSKRALLEEGLDRQTEEGRPLLAYLQGVVLPVGRQTRFLAVARAGLARLDAERGVNRLLLRDLVLAAISHYWIMTDVYDGSHPHDVDAERFLRTLTALVLSGTPIEEDPSDM